MSEERTAAQRRDDAVAMVRCPRCNGVGNLRVAEPECNGGRVWEPCDRCHGSGQMEPPRIAAAAICQGGVIYQLPPPARHHDVIRHMTQDLGIAPPVIGEQGFVTSDGRFVCRLFALRIAREAGQVERSGAPAHGLFSEDVW
jgi:hypothetical protein